MTVDTDDDADIQAPRVHGQHKLRPVAYTHTEYGRFPRRWECVSCGKESTSRNVFEKEACESPILWVQLGCPGDGLRVCEDCGAVFVGEYDEKPFYRRVCVSCGSDDIHRDDDPDTEIEDVIPGTNTT